MATTKKKTTTKKAAAPKKAVSKATVTKAAVVKKTPAKRAPAKKTPAKQSKSKLSMRSFRVAKDDQDFSGFRITRQTVYWIILVAFIIFAQLWILKLQIEVATLIDAQQQQLLGL